MPVHLRYRVPDVSIHLMLLFIMSDEEIKKQYTEFQYISCYSLSFQATPLAFHHLCFNTSHVTLYPDVLSLMLSQCSFQYISCYSLSELPPHLWRVLVPFQYISCYSLSRGTLKWAKRNKRFNTSHVTLYRSRIIFRTGRWCVSIHLMLLFIPKKSGHEHSVRTVSIHLMLLFIVTSLRKSYSFESFQNISCYSLSKFNHKDLAALVTFQYISCYSLSDADIGNYVYGKMFQYISCYSLSGISTSLHAVNACFNTSHVTLYQLRKLQS